MALAWRLSAPSYAHIFDGEGNRRHGARWNSPGRGVVYCSANLSLCVLETYVNIPPGLRQALPPMQAVQLAVPDDAGTTTVEAATLARLMTAPDARAAFRAIGDNWLSGAADLVLRAPSVVVPEELDIMLNPSHPRMADVVIITERTFAFDTRLARA